MGIYPGYTRPVQVSHREEIRHRSWPTIEAEATVGGGRDSQGPVIPGPPVSSISPMHVPGGKMVPVSLCSSSLQHKSLYSIIFVDSPVLSFLCSLSGWSRKPSMTGQIVLLSFCCTLVLHVGQESHLAGYTHTSMQNIISVGTNVCA